MKGSGTLGRRKNWNTPKHYVVVGEAVYDIMYDREKGYHCVLEKNMLKEEVLK